MPGNRTAIRYVRREKGRMHTCSACGGKLQATHSSRALNPSSRKPNRKFGGRLCGACVKRVIILQTRMDEGSITIDSVEVKMLPYMKNKKA